MEEKYKFLSDICVNYFHPIIKHLFPLKTKLFEKKQSIL